MSQGWAMACLEMAPAQHAGTPHPMVTMLPSSASQDLYPENTTTSYRFELPSCVVMNSRDFEVGLTSFVSGEALTHGIRYCKCLTHHGPTRSPTSSPESAHASHGPKSRVCWSPGEPARVQPTFLQDIWTLSSSVIRLALIGAGVLARSWSISNH